LHLVDSGYFAFVLDLDQAVVEVQGEVEV
jgi:hypothetical protein